MQLLDLQQNGDLKSSCHQLSNAILQAPIQHVQRNLHAGNYWSIINTMLGPDVDQQHNFDQGKSRLTLLIIGKLLTIGSSIMMEIWKALIASFPSHARRNLHLYKVKVDYEN